MNKWIPRFFYKKFDGGKESGVTGYFLVEWKPLFSIGILRFKKGSREAFHDHAFNAITWFLKGNVTEEKIDGTKKDYRPSFKPKITLRSSFHKVFAHDDTIAFTLRGPWNDTWQEFRPKENKFVTLTHGRKEINSVIVTRQEQK